MAGAGLKILPPDKYDGESDFERFTKLLWAYMGCQDNDYVHIMSTTQDATGEINQTATAWMQLSREEAERQVY